MATRAQAKRTIKLRNSHVKGRDFIRVAGRSAAGAAIGGAYSLASFVKFVFPEAADYTDWKIFYQENKREPSKPYFGLVTDSQIKWAFLHPFAPDPGAAGFQGWKKDFNLITESLGNAWISAAVGNIAQPTFTKFVNFIFDDGNHYIGTTDQQGNIIRNP